METIQTTIETDKALAWQILHAWRPYPDEAHIALAIQAGIVTGRRLECQRILDDELRKAGII